VSWSFDPDLVETQALHAVRSLVGDTQETRTLIDDEEITLQLGFHGLTLTSDPLLNSARLFRAAAGTARAIEAALAQKSELVLDAAGGIKSNAAQEYRRLARELEQRGRSGAQPTFADPKAYATTHVAGVDTEPALE
jgi:hypothetical protein